MDPGLDGYRARPFVCGVLGDSSPERVDRLRRAVPGLVTVHERPGILLLAGRRLATYRADSHVHAWSFGDRAPSSAGHWQAAAIDAEAPGVADLGHSVVLHAGALGFIDLFTRQLDGAIWFASRMATLLSLDDAPLEVDWESWAAILVFHCPMGDTTPFRSVRRLQGALSHTFDRATGQTRLERWSPPWHGLTDVDPDTGDAAAVVEQLRDVVRRVGGGPYALALSGGYDSRLVAIAARDAGLPVTAWNTSKDDDRDDVHITRELAALLGLPLRFVDPKDTPYHVASEEVRHRTEGMVSMHAWAGPLAAALRSNGRPVLTDILGGVLFAGANSSAEIVAMRPGRQPLLATMGMLARPPIVGRTLSERAAPWVTGAARDTWLGAVRHLDGDSNQQTLAMIETRDARGVAAQPMWLFGPEVPVEAPGCRPEMLRAAFGVGMRRKLDGAFSRELLVTADAVAGRLRTTHDREARPTRTTTRKAGSEGLAWLRADVERASSVPGLVPDGLLRFLELGRWAGPGVRERLRLRQVTPPDESATFRNVANVARLTLPLATFGAWIDRHRDRLASLDPPWEGRTGDR